MIALGMRRDSGRDHPPSDAITFPFFLPFSFFVLTPGTIYVPSYTVSTLSYDGRLKEIQPLIHEYM